MKTRFLLPIILLVAHFSFGAELYVKVNAPGNFRATVGGQMQSNNTNSFRFFDIQPGYGQLMIVNQQNNLTLFAGNLSLAQNERLFAEIDQFGNFRVVQRDYIQNTGGNNPYYNNSYYTNNPYPQPQQPGYSYVSNNNGYCAPQGGNGYQTGGNYYPNNNQYFQQFVQLMQNESFDSNKLTMARDYASRTQLSASQIADIAREFSFDSNRLDWAKSAYASCYDKQNYFLLKGVFSFSSNYNELVRYTSGH